MAGATAGAALTGAVGRSGLDALFSGGGMSARKRTVGSALGLAGLPRNPNCMLLASENTSACRVSEKKTAIRCLQLLNCISRQKTGGFRGLQLGRPLMGFALTVPAPRVKRVVHDHAMLKHFMVVGKGLRQAK